ncbi:MAG: hypothetical protein HY762_06885 [Planctomycetes bacterium]|nr:hypothetical protein [Planctomycetota bacterium]
MRVKYLLIAIIGCFLISSCGGGPNYDRSGLTAETYCELGISWLKNRHPDRAETVLLKAIELKPHYGEAYTQLGYAYYFLYEQRIVSEKYRQEAEKYYNLSYNCFNEGLKYRSDNPLAYAGLGRLAIAANQHQKAVEHLLKARELMDPMDFETEAIIDYDLGKSYLALEMYPQALAEFKNYLQVVPSGEEHDNILIVVKQIEKQLAESQQSPDRSGGTEPQPPPETPENNGNNRP